MAATAVWALRTTAEHAPLLLTYANLLLQQLDFLGDLNFLLLLLRDLGATWGELVSLMSIPSPSETAPIQQTQQYHYLLETSQ